MIRHARRRLCVECFEPRRLLAVDFATHQIPLGDGISPTFGDVADFDDDGDLDILMTVRLDPEDRDSRIIVWYENTDGHGDFGERHVISTMDGRSPLWPYAGDLDNDGDEDVITRIDRWRRRPNRLVREHGRKRRFWAATGDLQRSTRRTRTSRLWSTLIMTETWTYSTRSRGTQDDLPVIVLRENTDGRGSFGPPQTIIESHRHS